MYFVLEISSDGHWRSGLQPRLALHGDRVASLDDGHGRHFSHFLWIHWRPATEDCRRQETKVSSAREGGLWREFSLDVHFVTKTVHLISDYIIS